MSDYRAPDNIYWLFSSSAQAIAAFIGFLATGFFFVYERIDRIVEKDETLEEIYEVIRKNYYRRLVVLFILTGLSIILSLLLVFLNGFDLCCFGNFLRISVALLNIITIVWAIAFIIFIIDPNTVKKIAEKLIKENEASFKSTKPNSITRGEFIDRFIELEKILRELAAKYQITFVTDSRYGKFLPLGEIIRRLNEREIYNRDTMTKLLEISKLRNLAAHGQISNVESGIGESIEELLNQLSNLLDRSQ